MKKIINHSNHDLLREEVGRRFKRARLLKGYENTADLARAINDPKITKAMIYQYERGTRLPPSYVAIKVGAHLGTSPLWLLCLTDSDIQDDATMTMLPPRDPMELLSEKDHSPSYISQTGASTSGNFSIIKELIDKVQSEDNYEFLEIEDSIYAVDKSKKPSYNYELFVIKLIDNLTVVKLRLTLDNKYQDEYGHITNSDCIKTVGKVFLTCQK